jgi:hypothetical protein
MTDRDSASRRQALRNAGLAVATAMAGMLSPPPAAAHEGHDHAPRTILDLKGKLVRIVGPDDVVGDAFIQDRVTIRVNAEGRIVDLRYG